MSKRLAMSPQHQASGRVTVEPVRQRRRPWQSEAQGIEMVFEARAALWAAMHRESGRFVNDEHQAVAIKDAGQHLVRSKGAQMAFRFIRRNKSGTARQDKSAIALQEEPEAAQQDKSEAAEQDNSETAGPYKSATVKPDKSGTGAMPVEITHSGATEEAPEGGRQSWWRRLRGGLSRTSSSIATAITDLVTKRKLDAAVIEELEDVLIRADLGVDAAARIAAAVGEGRYNKQVSTDEVKAILAAEIEKILTPVAVPLAIDSARKPFVILVAGVNGSGKTTTIGKLAARLARNGSRVVLAAGDTFRAAAIEQLQIWGERTGSDVIAGAQGADAAGLAYEALTAARKRTADVLIVDTAGRLQNKAVLMDELGKMIRVMRKLDPTAPHAVLLVLDATVGQNALSQVEEFSRTAGVTGLVMTKLDSTARGGILAAISAKYRLPVHFIGVGEDVDDLAPFAAKDFARALAGLER
jgi:fused signal recognition particle receptor